MLSWRNDVIVDKNIGNYHCIMPSVFISGEAIDENVKYLVPTTSGQYLEKATYFKVAQNDVFYFKLDRNRQHKISREDVVIDLPPRKGSLKRNNVVLMPVESSGGKGANDKCGPKNHDRYIQGTFLHSEVKGKSLWLVESVYKRTYISFVSDS